MVQWKGFTGRKESVTFLGRAKRSTSAFTHLLRKHGRYPDTPPPWSGPSLCLWCSSAPRSYRPLSSPGHTCSPALTTLRGNREEAAVAFRTHSLNLAATTSDTHAKLTLPALVHSWSTVRGSFFSPPSVCFLRHSGVQCILVIQVAFAVCESNRL